MQRENVAIDVLAELRLPIATAQLVNYSVTGPADHVRAAQDNYRVDLSLTPRPSNARACYREYWHRSRFERIGRVCVMPPRKTVAARSDCSRQQTSVLCFLHPEPMREWFDGDIEWTDRTLQATLDIKEPIIGGLLLRLADELRHPGFATDVLAGFIAGQLTVELGRYCTHIKTHSPRGGLAPWRLRLIDERMNEATRAPSLSELATLCGISVRALTRGFRVSRDISIGDYVARRQLQHAQTLLRAGHRTKVVAHLLGFASPSGFVHAFRMLSGETPGQFLQRCKRQRA